MVDRDSFVTLLGLVRSRHRMRAAAPHPQWTGPAGLSQQEPEAFFFLEASRTSRERERSGARSGADERERLATGAQPGRERNRSDRPHMTGYIHVGRHTYRPHICARTVERVRLKGQRGK